MNWLKGGIWKSTMMKGNNPALSYMINWGPMSLECWKCIHLQTDLMLIKDAPSLGFYLRMIDVINSWDFCMALVLWVIKKVSCRTRTQLLLTGWVTREMIRIFRKKDSIYNQQTEKLLRTIKQGEITQIIIIQRRGFSKECTNHWKLQ